MSRTQKTILLGTLVLMKLLFRLIIQITKFHCIHIHLRKDNTSSSYDILLYSENVDFC